jgi:hypothetical protein
MNQGPAAWLEMLLAGDKWDEEDKANQGRGYV